MNPLVSVVIPTYNRINFLKQAIQSVKNQTYPDIEIIIVDDGSLDNTREYMKQLPYKYIRIHHSGKPGFVRNCGFHHSCGDYIAFLDSDDLWKPEKTKKQIQYLLNNPRIQICHTREIWKRDTTIVSQKTQKHKRQGFIFDDALKKCIIGPSTVMMTSKLFVESGMFHPDLEIAEDYELWLRITSRNEVGYIDEPLVIKRAGHQDQLSEKYGHIEFFRIQALEHILEQHILPENLHLQALQEMSRKCTIYAKGCIKRNKVDEARKFEFRGEKYKKDLENYPDINQY